jgi:hypothetical protein
MLFEEIVDDQMRQTDKLPSEKVTFEHFMLSGAKNLFLISLREKQN